jgi:hypothetical protein
MATAAQIGRRIEDRLEEVVEETILGFGRGFIKRTPVVTGRTVANWRVSFGRPSTTIHEDRDPGKRRTRAALKTAATQFRLARGQDVYITNPLPHIRVLERGRGRRQKGHFMVRQTLARKKQLIRAAIRRVKKRG